MFSNGTLGIGATVLLVVISQAKINVTNAYAGSLAWSNFFARLTHSHPGRVVWVVFNTLIALLLMELDVFQALGQILGLYSNIAISWMAAVVADLVINKPLGLSPPHIEFKRSHLHDINPVGVGAMGIASLLSVAAFAGLLGPALRPYAPFIALLAAFVAAPRIAWLTGGRYYLVRRNPVAAAGTQRCCICERDYESEDTAHCLAYNGAICSLCCSLDARCGDLCKPGSNLAAQWNGVLVRLLPKAVIPYLETGLAHYLLLMACFVPLLAGLLGLLYTHEVLALAPAQADLIPHLRQAFVKAFSALLLLFGIGAWWMVLTHKSRQVAQEESNRQTHLLMQEIDSHQRTDKQLQQAKQAADQANLAKSSYITAISHELRTPLNSILGYAQILDSDEAIPPNRRQAVSVIRKSGDHLLSVIEGTLDIARIEGGKMTLEVKAFDFPEFLQQIVDMFELQARNKGLGFRYETLAELPAVVRADHRRLRQVLINLLGNALKFTLTGGVVFRVDYLRDMAVFEVCDSGPGIPPDDIERIFEPFVRGTSAPAGGSVVGLTIACMLTDLMGGEMSVTSVPGEGSTFRARIFLPQVHSTQAARELPRAKHAAKRTRPARLPRRAGGRRRGMPAAAGALRAAPDLHGPGHARHRRLGDDTPHPPRPPVRRAHRDPLRQRLRQGPRQRRRHRRRRLHRQAAARRRAARPAQARTPLGARRTGQPRLRAWHTRQTARDRAPASGERRICQCPARTGAPVPVRRHEGSPAKGARCHLNATFPTSS